MATGSLSCAGNGLATSFAGRSGGAWRVGIGDGWIDSSRPGRTARAGGGWTELIIRATGDNKNVFYLGVGDDDPRDSHLLTGTTRSRNAFAWASYFRKLSDQVTVALEWSNWQFKTRGVVGGVAGPQGPSGTSNIFNLALTYQF